MTPGAFIAKWRASELKESSASQEHFIDLCRLLGEPTPAEADPAGEQVASGKATRVGLVATNSIRGGANRRALQAATQGRPIFDAWSDEPWVIDGAAVRVSLVCFSGAGDAYRP